MICNYGICMRTDTRPFKDGNFCPEHTPWKLAGRKEPPGRPAKREDRKRRSYASEWRQKRDAEHKRHH
jgi:hypothetical protein